MTALAQERPGRTSRSGITRAGLTVHDIVLAASARVPARSHDVAGGKGVAHASSGPHLTR